MGFRVGVDVGGTFTDLVVASNGQRPYTTKALSTPGDESAAVFGALTKAANHHRLSLQDFLAATEVIVLGTTVATNAMLQHRGAAMGLIVTKGFRDEIEIRRGIKESMFNVKLEPPHPIVPRRRRLGVTERLDYLGREVTPLDVPEAREAVRRLRAMQVESIGVCFLFSFLNPDHERQVKRLIQEEFPSCHVSLSCEVLPQVRDFERVSTTAVNAYVGPLLAHYLGTLDRRLKERGYRGGLYIMKSSGGTGTVEDASRRSVYFLHSGPAAGVIGGLNLAERMDRENIITADMGGTSYDVCLIHQGKPTMTTYTWEARYRVAVPRIEIYSIGAGGGSIAWVDRAGALRVGPRSAGANPGPACYGQGGTEPTVTDADLVLGYLNAASFAAGELSVDLQLAERAISEHVAKPLGMSVAEAAHAIFRVVNANMSDAIRVVSIQRGYDPREFALMAFGGAGPIHAGLQAEDLEIPTVIVPEIAPVFCGFGDLMADLKFTEVRTFTGLLDSVDPKKMGQVLDEMTHAARENLPKEHVLAFQIEWSADLRYHGEVHEITVPLRRRGQGFTVEDLKTAAEDFHALHEKLYAYRDTHSGVEVVNLQVDVIGQVPKPGFPEYPAGGAEPTAAKAGTRRIYLEESRGFAEVPVYKSEALQPGNLLMGPCVVDHPTTTVVVYPGQRAAVDGYRNIIIETAAKLRGGV
jgi:N-methylhydantoinase A